MKIGKVKGIVRNKINSLKVFFVGNDQETKIPHFEPYGFTSKPIENAEAVILKSGEGNSIAVLVDDRRYKLALENGEVAIYDNKGQQIKLTDNGIQITTNKNITVNCSNANINADNTTVNSTNTAINGNVNVSGNITASGTMTALSMTAPTISGGVVSAGSGLSVGGKDLKDMADKYPTHTHRYDGKNTSTPL